MTGRTRGRREGGGDHNATGGRVRLGAGDARQCYTRPGHFCHILLWPFDACELIGPSPGFLARCVRCSLSPGRLSAYAFGFAEPEAGGAGILLGLIALPAPVAVVRT